MVYKTEYEDLKAGEETPFVLVDDRKKTGAQILRKYDKSRYPGVFPKDLLRVVRTSSGLQVNGRPYDLLRVPADEATEMSGEEMPSTPSSLSAEMCRRVEAELSEVAGRMEAWQRHEEEWGANHLFLADTQRNILKNVMRRVKADIASMQIEIQELCHAAARG